jgi:DNA-binding CsgD family transcriptional regulator
MSARAADRGRLREVIKDLGDAVIEPAVWPDLMERLCSALQAGGAVLLQTDTRTPDALRTASMDEGVRFYFDHGWHNRDLFARGVPLLLGGEKVYVTQDIVTPEEMRREPFLHEVLYPHGFHWSAVVGIRAGPGLWGLSIQRTARQGPFEPDDKRLLADLSDHLTETATLSALVGQVALKNTLNALELIRQPAVAIDGFGCVLDANAAAESIFDEDLRVRMRRLVVSDINGRSELEALLLRLRLVPDNRPAPMDPVVVRKKNKPPTLIRMLPLVGAARAPFLGARALLLFSDYSRREPPSATLLAHTFGLSPSEARTAALLAEGLSTEKIANQLCLSRETIKSQLKTIFAKTGARRQAELVALFLALSRSMGSRDESD